MKKIHLQWIGEHDAIEAKDLRPGMITVWNAGKKSVIESVEFSKTGKTLTVTFEGGASRNFRATRLVAVEIAQDEPAATQEVANEPEAATTDNEQGMEESNMKTYNVIFVVDGIGQANMAIAESAEAVEAYYNREYSGRGKVIAVREATEWEIEENRRRGMPFVTVPAVTEEPDEQAAIETADEPAPEFNYDFLSGRYAIFKHEDGVFSDEYETDDLKEARDYLKEETEGTVKRADYAIFDRDARQYIQIRATAKGRKAFNAENKRLAAKTATPANQAESDGAAAGQPAPQEADITAMTEKLSFLYTKHDEMMYNAHISSLKRDSVAEMDYLKSTDRLYKAICNAEARLRRAGAEVRRTDGDYPYCHIAGAVIKLDGRIAAAYPEENAAGKYVVTGQCRRDLARCETREEAETVKAKIGGYDVTPVEDYEPPEEDYDCAAWDFSREKIEELATAVAEDVNDPDPEKEWDFDSISALLAIAGFYGEREDAKMDACKSPEELDALLMEELREVERICNVKIFAAAPDAAA